MWLIYDFIFLIIFSLSLPIYILRGKIHKGIGRRFGLGYRGLKLDSPIWIHAVSVGEAIMMQPLIAKLHEAFPQRQLVISTVTPTGNRIAQRLGKDTDCVTYLPLDFSFIVRRVISVVRPVLFILAETELWPNLIFSIHRQRIPVIVVNGRVSDASFYGYRLARFLFSPLLKKINFFSVQTDTDKARLVALGLSEDKIVVSGNMKFDILAEPPLNLGCKRSDLGLTDNDKLIVAGSTHHNEEELVIGSFLRLHRDYPFTHLFVAPRHPQRAKQVLRIVEKFGFRAVFLSELKRFGTLPDKKAIFILDTIGELNKFYSLADIVFVGGSLVRKGGHNILEPAFFAKPVIFGPHMFNFRDIASLFLEKKAALKVENSQELYLKLAFLLEHPQQAELLGKKARQLIYEYQGATAKNLKIIKRIVGMADE